MLARMALLANTAISMRADRILRNSTVSTCVGCHGPHGQELVQAEHPEVDKMRDLWAKGESIPG